MRRRPTFVLGLAVLALAACTGTSSTDPSGTRGASGAASSTGGSTTSSAPGLTAHLSLGATGDLLTHVAVRRSAEAYAGAAGSYDFAPMFRDVASMIAAPDISLCHMATPLTSTDTNLTPPHELIDAVRKTGWEGCDFASNHTWDMGLAGLRDTIDVFDKAKVGYAGAGPDAEHPRRVGIYQANGLTVAHLAYSYTVFNDFGPNTKVPDDAPWMGESLWPLVGADGILTDAKKARAEGADLVVVSLHWGAQYVSDPTPEQKELAKALLSSDEVDVILGTHVHVVQPCERINGKYVFYGLGNFLSNQSPQVDATLIPQTQEGVVVRVDFDRDASGKVTQRAAYRPTKVNLTGHVVEPATPQTNPVTFDRVTKTLDADGCGLTTLD